MIKGKTTSGFKFEVNENRLQDIRFIEMLSEADKNPLQLPKMISFVLGREQTEKLYEHVKEDDFVNAALVEKEMIEIFNAVKENNSSAKKS